MKLAAIEADVAHRAGARVVHRVRHSRTSSERTTHYAIRIPWVLGLIAHALDRRAVPGINELVEARTRAHRKRHAGLRRAAAAAAERQRSPQTRKPQFDAHKADLGYGAAAQALRAEPVERDAGADRAARPTSTIPNVPVLFWSFRIMVGCGFYFIALFALVVLASRRGASSTRSRWFLRLALWSLPLPWVAIELGWIVAEYGRQPWAIDGVLPTCLGVSSVSGGAGRDEPGRLHRSSTRALAVVECILMLKYDRARARRARHLAGRTTHAHERARTIAAGGRAH